MNWAHALAKVVATPKEFHYVADRAYCRQILRCSEADADEFYAAWNEFSAITPDAYDYWNAGLYSGSRRSRPEIEVAQFRRNIAKNADWVGPLSHHVRFEARCPRGAMCDSDVWSRPDIDGFVWRDSRLARERASWAGEIEQRGAVLTVTSATAAEVWHATLGRYRYHYSCPELAAAIDETRRRGVGDCLGLSLMLAAELQEHGIEARVRGGFLWGGTTGRTHNWVEAADRDGRWKTLDLSMAVLARDFAMGDYGRFCFGSQSNRTIAVGESGNPGVSHPCGGTALRVPLDVPHGTSGATGATGA